MTLAANLGRPCATERGPLLDRQTFRTVWDMLRALDAHLDPATHGMDPIAVLEAMAAPDGRAATAPLTYGYVSYAIAGFRPRRVHFADIPAAGSAGPIGSTLGGTGMAISARTAHPEAALDFAYWVCSADVQRGPYVAAGGQPGHSTAWEDDAANALTADFYRGTRATLEGANLRARHDGYMGFQHRSSIRIVEALEAKEGADTLGDDLDRMFAGSFR
jgi:multiple sugar transport system substrate-binding protein